MSPTLLCIGISVVVGAYAPLAYAGVNHLVPRWRKIDRSLLSFVRYIVVFIIASVLCFVVPLGITTSFMRITGMLPSPDPPAEHALLRVFCAFGWVFCSMLFIACHAAIKGGLKKSGISAMSPERERLVAIILVMTMLLIAVTGAAIGLSIVPYWSGGWELVATKWTTVGKPVEMPSAVLGLIGLIGGFVVGYFIFRKMALSTGLLTPEEIRGIDDAFGKEGRTG